jgi:predicted aminopeptidase
MGDRAAGLPLASIPLALLTLSACLPIHYSLQAGAGQLELWTQARPLEEVLGSPHTSPRVRRLLSEVSEVKRFGEQHGLRATSSYRKFVDLRRPAVVWAVSACPELSLQAHVWRFPIAGSVPYLGWFEQRAADEFGASLRAEGFDVEVRPVPAYSTLGWFDDPVLSSMLSPGNEGLAWLVETVLHESVHATLYVAGQSSFNEGLASFAGSRLAKAYLAAQYGPRPVEWLEERRRRGAARSKGWSEQLHAAALELDALYQDPAKTDDQKRARKREVLGALDKALGARRPITNATLAQHLTYRAGAGPGGFEQVLTGCNQDWPCFFAALSQVRPGDFAKAQQEQFDEVLGRLRSPAR